MTKQKSIKKILRSIILFAVFYMAMVICTLYLVSCAPTECPENEKVVTHYETVTLGSVTYTDAILECPINTR